MTNRVQEPQEFTTDIDEIDEADYHRSSDSTPLSYEEIKTGEQLEHYIEDIADTVRIGLDQSIAILTPWFFNNMPRVYYQTTPRQEKVRHLSAIITGHVFETKQTVELWDRARSNVTYIGPGGDRDILIEMAHKLRSFPFKMGALYFSRDTLLYLSTFFADTYKPLDLNNKLIVEKVEAARKIIEKEKMSDPQTIQHYFDNLDNDFVTYATVRRLQLTFRMVAYMHFHEGAHTIVEPFEHSPYVRLTLGLKNVPPCRLLETIIYLVQRYEFNIRRSFIVSFAHNYENEISVIHMILESQKEKSVDVNSVSMLKLTKALRTLGWVDSDEYDAFTRTPYNLSINAANLLRAIANWVHLALGKRNPYIYSMYNIQSAYHRYYYQCVERLVELFRIKFDPVMSKQRKAGRYDSLRKEIEIGLSKVIEEVDRDIFAESLKFIDHMLKTNYFMTTKTGLAFRLDPKLLDKKSYPNEPFGIFYIVGRDFRFFQMRWKDISRGGLRVVMPRSPADYDYALSGLFDEVYGLSYAQQLKNKDIPEGGSKAVLLLRPGGHRDQAVRGAVNALLDLLVSDDEAHEIDQDQLVSYLPRQEIIYLGPDENITNELINWITEQARRRGYEYANAFMSSKPGAGINHKAYGVTSEGVNVFVDNLLRFMGINPQKEDFTVKMTGGPDGDVAGNELKILHREYGEHAKVVAIADGFGAAYDPEGLNWSELLRLVEEGLSIDHFQRKYLSKSKEAFVVKADNNENILIRNQLCATKYADIFIPAGGRPYTINDNNWHEFLDEKGQLTLKGIVEGANIFFTDGARRELQNHGALIIKDSSANKTGVICSSYEIIAALILNEDEFKEIKEEYVADVIEILREKADKEAKLLFIEYSNFNFEKSLVELSLLISKEINELTDMLLEQFTSDEKEAVKDPLFQSIVYRHCPPVLVKKYKDRILQRLPIPHQIAIVSSYIASYIVYREGLGWLHTIAESERFEAARTYMEKDSYAEKLVQIIEKTSIKEKELISAILKRSAARDLTVLALEKKHHCEEGWLRKK